MNDAAATKQDLNNLEERLDKRFDEFMTLMSSYADGVNARFDRVEGRIDAMDGRITALDGQMAIMQGSITAMNGEITKLTSSHHHVLNTLDSFMARIDTYEVESVAHDRQFGRLTDWAYKVAAKTATPLKDV